MGISVYLDVDLLLPRSKNAQNAWRLSIVKCALAVAVVTCSVLVTSLANAQTSYQPAAKNLKAGQELQDVKFGMFIRLFGCGGWCIHPVLS